MCNTVNIKVPYHVLIRLVFDKFFKILVRNMYNIFIFRKHVLKLFQTIVYLKCVCILFSIIEIFETFSTSLGCLFNTKIIQKLVETFCRINIMYLSIGDAVVSTN